MKELFDKLRGKNMMKVALVAAFIIAGLFIIMSSKTIGENTNQNNSSENNQSQSETTESEDEDDKGVLYYLSQFKIGTSNAVAFVILGGVLIGIQVKRKLDEQQEESK